MAPGRCKAIRMAQGEASFWNRLVSALAPGWSAVVDDGVVQGVTSLSSVDTFIYVLDTHTGWVGVAGIVHEIAQKVALETRASAELMSKAGGSAIELIASMSDRGAVAGDDATRQATFAGLVALATTKTIDAVMERQGHLRGHFLYLVHTPKVGLRIGRPAFRTYGRVGVMPIEEVLRTAADVTRLDLGPDGGSVNREIKAAGGLKLCSQLDLLVG